MVVGMVRRCPSFPSTLSTNSRLFSSDFCLDGGRHRQGFRTSIGLHRIVYDCDRLTCEDGTETAKRRRERRGGVDSRALYSKPPMVTVLVVRPPSTSFVSSYFSRRSPSRGWVFDQSERFSARTCCQRQWMNANTKILTVQLRFLSESIHSYVQFTKIYGTLMRIPMARLLARCSGDCKHFQTPSVVPLASLTWRPLAATSRLKMLFGRRSPPSPP